MIKLSICIPTYNRAKHLNGLLVFLKNEVKFGFDYEIIISDNCSEDETVSTVNSFAKTGLPIRLYINQENIGQQRNVISALRHAKGQYLIYLADDDRIIPEEISNILLFLDAHPEIVGCYAPWQIWDETTQTQSSQTFNFEHPVVIDKSSWLPFFETMINKNILLEIGIFRTKTYLTALLQPDFCFWADLIAVHLLQYGSIVLSNRPYYRYLINTAIARDRPNEGSLVARYGWDSRLGGAEYFFHYASQMSGLSLDRQQLDTLSFLLEVHRIQRMLTALGIMMKSGEHLERHYLYCRAYTALSVLRHADRISLLSPGNNPEATKSHVQHFIVRLKQELDTYKPNPDIVSIQAVVRLLRNINATHAYYLSGDDSPHLEENLRNQGLPPSVSLTKIDTFNDILFGDIGDALIIAEDDKQKNILLDNNIPSLQIIALADIRRHYQP